jgi:hypothetical protein
MIPGRLLEKLDSHWEELIARVVRQIRSDPSLAQFNERLTSSEIRLQAQTIQNHLHLWIRQPEGVDLSRHYEAAGRVRCAEGIPLYQCIRAVQLVKRTMVDYTRDQNVLESAMDIYAEEEFEHDLDRFFDEAIYELARGYEAALRHSPMAMASR